ncbi:hypothetical protein D0469_13665 [Peribacillus saganii]|uniref:Uncharacterized protein n=1 Tax=Peribacillus saganii TaxID=2303992 RepID=A0A372LLN5_9BACI|nr:hypothetical protein [Peribacillus saganii]RFU67770.1 hypothetical protein D0469_13665 [Peribacillus saganii]
MKYLRNQKGNSTFYLLWLLGIVALIFVLTINIVKVYVVKEQANLSVEQAALAGTSVLLETTDKAVKDFDAGPESVAQKALDGGHSISKLIEDKQNEYINNGDDETNAYIKAANDILPPRLDKHPLLKMALRDRLGVSGADISTEVAAVVQDVIAENKANREDTTIEFSKVKWRLEVKSTATFESISDNRYITYFLKDIPQRGYGPVLEYLESVYSSSVIL